MVVGGIVRKYSIMYCDESSLMAATTNLKFTYLQLVAVAEEVILAGFSNSV